MENLLTRIQSIRLDTRHPTNIALIATSTLAALGLSWLIWDYRAWLSFGTGGTPPTMSGYWRMTKIRWAIYRSGDDLCDSSKITTTPPAYLSKPLPTREGPRPRIVSRTMPQRQVPSRSIPQEVHEAIAALPRKLRDATPGLLLLEPSPTEGGSTDALIAKRNLPGRDARAYHPILGDEIAHVHPSDSSLHVWLAPADAREVVAKRWGQKFPLTTLGKTPEGFVMVYAPRTLEEVDVIEEIVSAAVEFLTGFKV